MEVVFSSLIFVVYVGIVIYCLMLFSRLVRAVEKLADKFNSGID